MWLNNLLSITALALAYLSWRFVERPFRNRHRFTRKQIFTAGFIGSLLFIGIGTAFLVSDGAMHRFT